MKMLKPVLASAALCLIAVNGFAAPNTGLLFDQEQCASNCVLSMRSANNLIVVARNSEGAVFKTLSFAMPRDARLLYASDQGSGYPTKGRYSPVQATSAATQQMPSECVNMPGVCTSSNVRTYVTPSYYVFYTYTYVFRDGKLLEINVEETRIARNIIK